ncbi:hypothetical protein EZV62_005050 [Acer yangbiense]|uniref:Aquaporin n=1 Tax=Acer yangbiense TaxID=1000413 RepID=A0A5C7ILP7_9ROSI|nr:hypothetical protein EZV62_005050 [Acer yangbiense]
MVGARLIVSDFVLSFMWVWAGVLAKMFVVKVLGLGHEPLGEVIKCGLSIVYMFLFAFLGKVTHGGAYNPLTVLSSAISGDFSQFLLTVGARIPIQNLLENFGLNKYAPNSKLVFLSVFLAEIVNPSGGLSSVLCQSSKRLSLHSWVLGSIYGVRLIIETFPEVGLGPRLNVNIHHGALTEGVLTFAIVIISLGLARNIPGSFYMKTWISSVSKIALHILGSDLTGGCMNPAAVMGWAYARGDHITKEHILVYWLAPVEATLLAVWTFKLIVRPQTEKKKDSKSKSE